MSPRFARTFQFAHLRAGGAFTLTTATFAPCRDPRAPHPGFTYDEERGTLRRLGDGFAVDTDRGNRIVLDVRAARITMRDAEGSVTLRRIAERDLQPTADRYRAAVVDRPDARC